MFLATDYEIIEVNGFVIKRRKSGKPPKEITDQPTQPSQVGPYNTPPPAEVTSEPIQRTPNVEEYEISAELYERLTKALHEFPENAAPSGRLLAVCSSVCAAEVDTAQKYGNPNAANGLQLIFNDFLNCLSQALDQQSIIMAPPTTDDGLAEADLKIDLESRKRGLRRRLEILRKVIR